MEVKSFNFNTLEKWWWINRFGRFTIKNDFFSRFGRIRIKRYYSEVSKVAKKYFYLHDISASRLLIKIRNINGPENDFCETTDKIMAHYITIFFLLYGLITLIYLIVL